MAVSVPTTIAVDTSGQHRLILDTGRDGLHGITVETDGAAAVIMDGSGAHVIVLDGDGLHGITLDEG